MRRALACLLVVSAPSLARAAVTETSSTPYPGITHVVRTDDAIPAVAHILIVDLSSDEIRLEATGEPDRGQRSSQWATGEGLVAAVNGDLHDPFSFTPAGLAWGGGAAWTTSADTEAEGFLVFDRAMDANHARIEVPDTVVAAGDLAAETEGVVAGRPMLVHAGVAETAFDCADAAILACERAPRTAVGLSEDGRTLYLVVVDGWQADSLGLTAAETAGVLADRGAHEALAFDPGGSSTLFVAGEGGVVSSPSDGVERFVANQLGVRYGMLPPGTMLGFIRERDVFSGADIAGATVSLDSGESMVTAADGRYQFTGLTPRYVCATATHPGYHPVTQCRDVPSAGMIYNSIALYPNSDFIDAGLIPTPDAAPDVPDARPTADAGPAADGGADAGEEPTAPPTCGCSGAGDSADGVACLLLVAPAMLRNWSRRRVRKRG